MPLRNDAGELLPLSWVGQKTLRVTILDGGNEDLDGFVLAPASSSGPDQLFEVMGQDLGPDVAGFGAGTAVDSITLTQNSRVRLTDLVDNASGAGPEALYVRSLVLPTGATLDLNGIAVFAQEIQIAGEVIGGTIRQVLPQAPGLAIRPVGNQVEIAWPASAGGYHLESTEHLPPMAAWENVPDVPVTVADTTTVTQSAAVSTRFYRLRHD